MVLRNTASKIRFVTYFQGVALLKLESLPAIQGFKQLLGGHLGMGQFSSLEQNDSSNVQWVSPIVSVTTPLVIIKVEPFDFLIISKVVFVSIPKQFCFQHDFI